MIFPGSLNPPDAIAGRWHESLPARSPGEHLRAGFSGAREESLLKHLRHYARPSPWVEELWRE